MDIVAMKYLTKFLNFTFNVQIQYAESQLCGMLLFRRYHKNSRYQQIGLALLLEPLGQKGLQFLGRH
jgi:hypothetical protein